MKCIIVKNRGREFEIKKLKRVGNTLVDSVNGKTYVLNGKPILLNGKITYILSDEKGVVLEPEVDEDVLKLKTNPSLISTILEPEILHRAFKFKPAVKQLIVAFIFGVIVGIVFFAPVI